MKCLWFYEKLQEHKVYDNLTSIFFNRLLDKSNNIQFLLNFETTPLLHLLTHTHKKIPFKNQHRRHFMNGKNFNNVHMVCRSWKNYPIYFKLCINCANRLKIYYYLKHIYAKFGEDWIIFSLFWKRLGKKAD